MAADTRKITPPSAASGGEGILPDRISRLPRGKGGDRAVSHSGGLDEANRQKTPRAKGTGVSGRD